MSQYDAIIVGARCGGAPLAMLLARAGHRVLLLDRMAFGSDIMSTHYVKRTGASLLEKWGLLDELRNIGTPAIKIMNFQIDDLHLAGQAPAHEGVATDFTSIRSWWTQRLLPVSKPGIRLRSRNWYLKTIAWLASKDLNGVGRWSPNVRGS